MAFFSNPPKTELSYPEWNNAVARYFFNDENEGCEIRLSVDPLVLQQAAASVRTHEFPSPEAAASDFIQAVRWKIDSSDRNGWRLGDIREDYKLGGLANAPHGLAKLALQVLAVFFVKGEVDPAGSSYWASLRKILGQGVEQKMPDGLKNWHVDNWRMLTKWANEVNQGRLGLLPDPEEFPGYQYVRLPLNHGLLRLEDVQELPRFFTQLQDHFVPGEEVAPQELIPFIKDNADDPKVFPRTHARRVLTDSQRLRLAAAQIADALRQWDGADVLRLDSSRRAVDRVWVAAHGKNPFRLQGGVFQTDSKGEDREVSGVSLQDALIYPSRASLNRSAGTGLVVTVQSELDKRYREKRQALPGDKVILLQRQRDREDRFLKSLRFLAVDGVSTCGTPGSDLPPGWTAFRLRLRPDLKADEVPSELRRCIRFDGLRLRLFGGLRIRRIWIPGAGPSLKIHGGKAKSVVVDGEECKLVDGMLHPHQCHVLDKPGAHEVWLPGRRQDSVKFMVKAPRRLRFSDDYVSAGWRRKTDGWPMALREADDADATVRGPVVLGSWAAVDVATPAPMEELLIPLILLARGVRTTQLLNDRQRLREAGLEHPNLLIRQLAQSLPAGA